MNEDIKITDSRKLKNLRLMTKTGRHLHIENEISTGKGVAVLGIAVALLAAVAGLFICFWIYALK